MKEKLWGRHLFFNWFFSPFSFFLSPFFQQVFIFVVTSLYHFSSFLSYNFLFLLALIINQIFVSFALVKGIVIVVSGYNFFSLFQRSFVMFIGFITISCSTIRTQGLYCDAFSNNFQKPGCLSCVIHFLKIDEDVINLVSYRIFLYLSSIYSMCIRSIIFSLSLLKMSSKGAGDAQKKREKK